MRPERGTGGSTPASSAAVNRRPPPGGFSCKPGARLHQASRELPVPAAKSPRSSLAATAKEQRAAEAPPSAGRQNRKAS